jgi:hypothetical protein
MDVRAAGWLEVQMRRNPKPSFFDEGFVVAHRFWNALSLCLFCPPVQLGQSPAAEGENSSGRPSA